MEHYKLKVRELVEVASSIETLLTTKLPAPIAFKLGRTLRVLRNELQTFEEAKMRLIEQARDDGTLTKLSGDQWLLPTKLLDPLLDTEITLPVEQIHIRDLQNVELEPAVFMQLGFLFIDN